MKTSLRRIAVLATVAVGSFALFAGPASSSASAAVPRSVSANAEWSGTITAVGKSRSFTLRSKGVKYKVDYTSKTPITPKGDKPAVKDRTVVTGYLKSANGTTIKAEDIALKLPKK